MTATGQSYKFCVTSSGGPLKVTLAWHDPPASLAATTQLVNDLDLTVYANSLNGYGLLGNGVPDRLNNVEQVSRRTPACVAQQDVVKCSVLCCAVLCCAVLCCAVLC